MPRPGEHPDPGLIAAHAERRLAGEEAARIDAHIAACPICHEVFAETLRFALDEEDEEGLPRPWPAAIPFVRRPAFRMAAALAVAFGVFLAFQEVRRARSKRAETPLVAELARAMGTRRFVEPRLTGGFRHGRLVVLRSGDAPQGLDAHSPAVLSAVARIRERAGNDTSPEALGALGITYLVSGDVPAAVKALESAAAQDPENARLQSDLAAAYLVRASRLDEPADIPKALEAAERAIAREDPPDEAHFNRALALESLHLVDAARKAWDDYLKRDSTSGWADEARRHLEELPRARQSSAEEDKARVRTALEGGPAAVDRLADESPSLLRDYFQDELLPAWADAYLTGHPDARPLRDNAQLVGAALLRTTGDALPQDTARALTAPSTGTASADPLRAQALGFRRFREAKRLYEQLQPSCAESRAVREQLQAGGSPYASWVGLQVVIVCLFGAESKAAAAELDRIEAVAAPRRYAQLLGRLHWMQGLILADDGDLTASLARYRLARRSFVEIREPESEAGTLTLIAQDLRLLGEDRRAWRDRVQSLALLGLVRSPHRRNAVLDEAVHACLAEHAPRSGLHFVTALVVSALRWSAAGAASEALMRRASLRHALGDRTGAAADLEESRRFMTQVSDPTLAQRLAAQAEATRGELLASEQPEVAVRSLQASLSHFRVTAPQRVPSLELLLARALVKQGLDDAAEHELLAGIQELEKRRASVRDPSLQISFFDQGQPLFEEMVRLQVKREEHERGLAFVERARSRQLVDSLPGSVPSAEVNVGAATLPNATLDPEALQRDLPEGVALLYYMALEERLVAWVLSRGGSRCVARDLSATRLRQLVASHRAALEQPLSVEAARRTGAALYDELVRPLLPALASRSILIVVPDGTLQALPFASLVDRQTGHYLVEDHLLGMAPSGTVFVRASAAASSSHRRRHALIVGNPRLDPQLQAGLPSLPGAEAEAAEIARLYDSPVLLSGSRATKAAFLEAIRASEIVHYAGHAASSADPSSPARLFLAPDRSRGDSGALDLDELAHRRFPRTRLVVLAACRTGAGAISSVEGALSLGRPFLAAGVPSVVASLWDIEDTVSRHFFVAFHRALLTEGEPLLALRQTQIALLRDEDPSLAHPGTWAGFICMGGLDRRVVAPALAEAPPR